MAVTQSGQIYLAHYGASAMGQVPPTPAKALTKSLVGTVYFPEGSSSLDAAGRLAIAQIVKSISRVKAVANDSKSAHKLNVKVLIGKGERSAETAARIAYALLQDRVVKIYLVR